MILKFSGRGLAFLGHYMAVRDIRFYLNGIYLAPMPDGQGVIGTATNGHVMGLWRDPDGHIERPAIMTINKGLLSACAKGDTTLQDRDGRLVCVDKDGGETYVQPNGLRTRTATEEAWEIVNGNFPCLARILKLIDKAEGGAEACVSADYLALISKSLPKRKRGYSVGVTMRQSNVNNPVLVRAPTIPEAVIIIMPMREDHGPTYPWLEKWINHNKKLEEIAALPLPGRQPSDAVPPADFKPIRVPTTMRGAR